MLWIRGTEKGGNEEIIAVQMLTSEIKKKTENNHVVCPYVDQTEEKIKRAKKC